MDVHALSGKVAHVANQLCFSTSCLSHNYHWNATSVCGLRVCMCVGVGVGGEGGRGEEGVRGAVL